jgi:hypothetical protein
MNITKEDIKNLSIFLTMGKFTINADEAIVLAILKQKLVSLANAPEVAPEIPAGTTNKKTK